MKISNIKNALYPILGRSLVETTKILFPLVQSKKNNNTQERAHDNTQKYFK